MKDNDLVNYLIGGGIAITAGLVGVLVWAIVTAPVCLEREQTGSQTCITSGAVTNCFPDTRCVKWAKE